MATTSKKTAAPKTTTARAARALPAKAPEQDAADRAEVVAQNLEADARALRGRGKVKDADELDAKAAAVRKPAKKATAPKLDKSVEQAAPADELPVIDRTEPDADDAPVVCGTDTSATEEPGEPIPAPELADEPDVGADEPEQTGDVPELPAEPGDASEAFAAAFGAAETARAETAAAKPARAPRGERVKPAAELPFGTAHGAKAARLRAVLAHVTEHKAPPADATPHELVQTAVSFNAPPAAGWTRGSVTAEVRKFLPGFAYSAVQSAAAGVGIEIHKVDGSTAAVPRDAARAPRLPNGNFDMVELFRAHLAGMDPAAARLLLAELAAPYVTAAPERRDETADRGAMLEID